MIARGGRGMADYAFGSNPPYELWMNVQSRFDLETTEDTLAPQIKKIASY